MDQKLVQEMKENFVEMKVQEEMRVLRNELEMSVAPILVGRWKEPILGYVPKNDEKMNLVHKGLKKMKIFKLHQPFKAQEDTGVPFHRNFNSILGRDLKKKFLWASRL